ncbi:endoplasmic reticulum-based factor for assembly of V-ATPase-domain-containing protein [Chytriomyces sp. MP71]|nr:endoplasmic reticulum-based factor for assembly of V-ATPase-domain-containing protein [Chytriomyces sp. MP71]
MVLVKVTSRLHHAIETAFECIKLEGSGCSEEVRLAVEQMRNESVERQGGSAEECSHSPTTMSHANVRMLSDVLTKAHSNSHHAAEYSFDNLLKGSSMVFPRREKREKSEELKRLLHEAKTKSENLEYEKMTEGLRRDTSIISRQERSEYKAVMGMFSALVNVLFSMVAVFVAVFYVGHTVTSDVGMKTLLALFFAFVVGIAEGYFFSRDWLLI